MVLESYNGLMAIHMKEISQIITMKEMDFLYGIKQSINIKDNLEMA